MDAALNARCWDLTSNNDMTSLTPCTNQELWLFRPDTDTDTDTGRFACEKGRLLTVGDLYFFLQKSLQDSCFGTFVPNLLLLDSCLVF